MNLFMYSMVSPKHSGLAKIFIKTHYTWYLFDIFMWLYVDFKG